MRIFKVSKAIDRLNKMIDNAIDGKPLELGFDESRMSALETKLSNYLAMNSATKTQLSEEKSRINELISDISHQTKTPLANIVLYAQILEESDLPQKEQECVKALVGQADKLSFLISSLVKVSRLETGAIAVSPKHTQVQPLLDSVGAYAGPKAAAKGISLLFEATEAFALFDLKWTAEALHNIVDNAIKYTPQGGRIDVKVSAYQLFCRIDVNDTGIGISEGETAKIFSRFYRSQAVSDEEGVGLGLYLAREIISNQGGYIKVNSTLNKGSTFSVFLPIHV